MGILNFKKHKITPIIVTKGYEDDNGDYFTGTTTNGEPEMCNAVPNGKANEITFEDGVSKKYAFECKLSADCREYSLGERVILQREGREGEYEVLGFIRHQHSSKLWLG